MYISSSTFLCDNTILEKSVVSFLLTCKPKCGFLKVTSLIVWMTSFRSVIFETSPEVWVFQDVMFFLPILSKEYCLFLLLISCVWCPLCYIVGPGSKFRIMKMEFGHVLCQQQKVSYVLCIFLFVQSFASLPIMFSCLFVYFKTCLFSSFNAWSCVVLLSIAPL